MRFWIVMITSKIPLKIDHMYSDAYENRYSTTVHTFVFFKFLCHEELTYSTWEPCLQLFAF